MPNVTGSEVEPFVKDLKVCFKYTVILYYIFLFYQGRQKQLCCSNESEPA